MLILIDFPSGAMYKHFYSKSVEYMDRVLDTSMSAAIRTQFIQFIDERRGRSTAQQHLSFIGKQQGMWAKCRSTEICLVCLGGQPRRRLSCGHRLCDDCVIMCELATSPEVDWPRSDCPLCREKNDVDLSLRPATSGLRTLEIVGAIQSKVKIVDFLRQLQHHVGLPLYALREQFDLVKGSGIGIYCSLLVR